MNYELLQANGVLHVSISIMLTHFQEISTAVHDAHLLVMG